MKFSPSAFPCELCWQGRRAFFIWLSNDRDAVVLDEVGSMRLFGALDSLSQFTSAEGLVLAKEEPPIYDFDAVLARCVEPCPPVDCARLLNSWNTLGDIHASRGNTNDLLSHPDRGGRAILRKTCGCNLPALTPEGHSDEPVWSAEDCRNLAQLLRLGLTELDSALPARP